MEFNNKLKVKEFSFQTKLSGITKVISGLVLATVIAISMPACSISDGNNGGSGDNTTDGTTPGDNTSGSKYSQILENVLNSDYYDKVIDDYVASGNKDADNSKSPIPYAFLEREGLDVDAIKDNQLECRSIAYTINNDTSMLYLSTLAETSEGYYANYILSYSLTQQEYDDLYMLHEGNYIQAGLFVQELDAQKNAKVESHVNVEKETFSGLENRIRYLCDDYINTDDVYIDVTSANADAEFTLNVRSLPLSTKYMIIEKQTLRKMECHSYLNSYSYTNYIVYMNDSARFATNNLDEFKANSEPITYFDSAEHHSPSLALENDLNKHKNTIQYGVLFNHFVKTEGQPLSFTANVWRTVGFAILIFKN